MKKHFEQFQEIRKKIDEQCAELWDKHNEHMQCRAGCSSCCQSFKVLPLEFHFIQESIRTKHIKINTNFTKGECKFLVDNKCMVYEDRPIICRTHGYPLARLNEEAGAYEISFCKLNFKGFQLSSFNKHNVYFEDDFNSQLYALNKEFIQEHKEFKYDSIELIEVNKLEVDIE